MSLRKVIQQAVRSSSIPNLARAYSSSRYVNNIQLLGRVGSEPRKVGVNEAVAFPLFTESVVKLKDGTTKVYSCWHKVLFVKKALGEVVFNNVDRGQRVFVTGRIAYKGPETTEEGKLLHSYQAAIIADQIIFLEKKRAVEEVREEAKESITA